jgi:hypothetical protein
MVAKQRLARSRAAGCMAKWGRGQSGVGDGFLGDIRSSGKGAKPRGVATIGVERSPRCECSH